MKKIVEIMTLSIFEVFEKMFYIFLEPLNGEGNKYDMEASIRFEGPMSGEIRILLSTEIIKTMIQNMLDLKEDKITIHKIEDCSKEAVNIICGNFLEKLDSAEVFNLSVPIFRRQTKNLELAKNGYRMDFDSDGEKVSVIVEAI